MHGPVERTLDEGLWNFPDEKRYRAVVLDAAGAKPRDVEAAWSALNVAVEVRAEWDYFTSVITRRIAERVLLLRELQEDESP